MRRNLRCIAKALGILIAFGLISGGDCVNVGVITDSGFFGINVLRVELINQTEFFVDPRLFADDDPFDLEDTENRVEVAEIPPFGVRYVTLRCGNAEVIESDHAEFVVDDRIFESDNDPQVRADGDFDCGDVVSFIFIDTGREFFTRVEVNGFRVED